MPPDHLLAFLRQCGVALCLAGETANRIPDELVARADAYGVGDVEFLVVPTGVFAATDDFGSADHALAPRIERAAGELVAAWGVPSTRPVAAASIEEGDEVTPFSDLLRQAGQA